MYSRAIYIAVLTINNPNLFFIIQIVTRNLSDENDDEEKDNPAPILNRTTATPEVLDKNLTLVRSKTMPTTSMQVDKGTKRIKEPNLKQAANTIIADRLKLAKEEAERAIKVSIILN